MVTSFHAIPAGPASGRSMSEPAPTSSRALKTVAKSSPKPTGRSRFQSLRSPGLGVCAATLTLILAAPAQAQSVDWSRAGGDLFGRVPPAVEVTARIDGPPRLVPLSQPFADAIASAAARHGLDPKLLHALVLVESAYRPDAVSPVGAGGLTQLMPGTAADLGVTNRFDPTENLSGGADYLARQLLRFGDVRLALAAYNAGPGRVARLGRIPDIAETRAYVTAVVDCYLALTAGRGARNARQCRSEEARP